MASVKTIASSLLLPVTQKFRLPQTLIYFVTARCNAVCDFCLYREQLNNPESGKNELTVEEINLVAQSYGPLHYLGISGGEPFIRKDLYELCAAFARHCGLQVLDIPSNFYYGERMAAFVQRFAGEFPEVTVDLQLSLDNTGEAHDISRKVNGLYQKATDNFRQLHNLKQQYPNLRLKVNLIYLPENRNELPQILNTLNQTLPFDRIQLTYPHHLLPAHGHSTQPTEELNHFFNMAELADNMTGGGQKKDMYALGLKSLKSIYRKLLTDAISGQKNTGTYCHAGSHIAVMNETGEVFPCEILWNQKLGNVRQHNYSIREILHGHSQEAFEQKYLGKGKCNCTWSCAFNTQVSVNYVYYPALAATAFNLMLKKDG